MATLPIGMVQAGRETSGLRHRTACALLFYSFNSQPKAYLAALTVRLRLTVKRNAFGKALNQQASSPSGRYQIDGVQQKVSGKNFFA